jgi:hypothetical protein
MPYATAAKLAASSEYPSLLGVIQKEQNWQRRKHFMMFLVTHGYTFSPSVQKAAKYVCHDARRRVSSADNAFSVYDMSRIICSYL